MEVYEEKGGLLGAKTTKNVLESVELHRAMETLHVGAVIMERGSFYVRFSLVYLNVLDFAGSPLEIFFVFVSILNCFG